MSHPTTEPETDDREVLAERLCRDLEALAVVAWARVSDHNAEIVKLQVASSHGLPPDVSRVLADHGATLSGLCLESDPSFQTAKAHPPRP